MAAAILDVQEIELDKGEAEQLGNAVKEVSKHYAVSIDPKKVAIANLFSVVGFIYGTRIIAYRARMKEEKKKTRPIAVVPKQESARAAAGSGSAAAQQRAPMTPSEMWTESAEMQAAQ